MARNDVIIVAALKPPRLPSIKREREVSAKCGVCGRFTAGEDSLFLPDSAKTTHIRVSRQSVMVVSHLDEYDSVTCRRHLILVK